MDASEVQLARLLAMVPYLQTHPGISVAEAADVFHVTPATVLSDLKILYMCGLPGQAGGDLIEVDLDLAEDEGIIYLRNADYWGQPLALFADEAFGLTLALNYVANLGDTSLTEAAASAAAKISAAVGVQPTRHLSTMVANANQEVRDAVETAIRSKLRLQLTYDAPLQCSSPVVEPHSVVVRQGIAYLQGWSVDAADWRTYRMERIASALVVPEAAADRGKAPRVPTDWNDVLPFHGEVTVEVDRDGHWISEYYPVHSVTASADGGETVHLGVASDDWLKSLLLRLGPSLHGIDPADAGVPALDAAKQALSRYDEIDARLAL